MATTTATVSTLVVPSPGSCRFSVVEDEREPKAPPSVVAPTEPPPSPLAGASVDKTGGMLETVAERGAAV